VLICSDMHLHDAQPQTTEFFLDWLSCRAQGADYLLLLGDVFDAWVGDDLTAVQEAGNTPPWKALSEAIASLRDQRPLYLGLMVGNRDFLMGPGIARLLGANCLADYLVLSHPGLSDDPALLCHGDSLCIADTAYQKWRAQARSHAWQQQFLSEPLARRQDFAMGLRMQSEQEKEHKPSTYMDVVPEEADRLLTEYGAGVLVHGHTHLPGCYRLPSGRPRWVLPDWAAPHEGARGGGLQIDGQGIRVAPLV
jgi:UDP-2,3-diacylglucosamine hydrolase